MYDSENNLKVISNIIKSTIEYAKQNVKQEIVINHKIKNEMYFNAKATLKANQTYEIVINNEVYKKLFNVYNTLLYEGNEKFYKLVSYEDKYDKDKADKLLDLMMELSIRMIVGHELGHIINGHLKHKASIENKPEATMFMDSDKNKLNPFESQTLEMDADAFAATLGIGFIGYENNIAAINNAIPNLLKSVQHAAWVWQVASVIIFSIQGLGQKREKVDLSKTRYLPLRTRQDMYVRCMYNACSHMYPNVSWNMDHKLLRECLLVIERFVNLYNKEVLGFEEEDFNEENNIGELNQRHLEHCDKIDEYWREILRDKLIQHTYLKLAD